MNRYYSSTLGRFTTPDPYMATMASTNNPGSPQSWNRYTYVSGDPNNYVDRSGLAAQDVDSEGEPGPNPYPDPPPTLPGRPTPPTKWDRALLKLSDASDLLHRVLLGNPSKNCQGDMDALGSLGIGGFQIPDAVDNSNWNDATKSTALEYQLYVPGTDVYNYYSSFPTLTIAQVFKNVPGTKAEAALPGSALAGNIYFDPNYVNQNSYQFDAAVLMHEVLHNLGATDDEVQTALWGAGSPEVGKASDNITQKFFNDCFKNQK